MKITLILICLLFLSGCGGLQYRTTLYVDGQKKAELKSNTPAFAKDGDVEIDQRRESLWEKIIPKTLKLNE